MSQIHNRYIKGIIQQQIKCVHLLMLKSLESCKIIFSHGTHTYIKLQAALVYQRWWMITSAVKP